jgi:PAS domain S-box-containing protein
MAHGKLHVTGRERFFGDDQIIVSKTDLKGRITYANDVFLDIADYSEDEVIGQPHSLIRHPDMPRAVFRLLWDRLRNGHEIFAYVKNRAKNGDHYWVIAHITPSRDAEGRIVGYHSNRRPPNRKALDAVIEPLYRKLRDIEGGADAKRGLDDSYRHFMAAVEQAERDYDATVFALERM